MRLQRGFNLIEVVLAIGILGIVLLLLMGLMMTATSGANSSHETVVATAIAESEIDRWKREEFAHLVSSIGTNLSSETVEGKDYRINVRIDRFDNVVGSPDFDVLRLISIVNWESRTVDPSTRQRTGQVRLETHLSASARY